MHTGPAMVIASDTVAPPTCLLVNSLPLPLPLPLPPLAVCTSLRKLSMALLEEEHEVARMLLASPHFEHLDSFELDCRP